MTGGAMSSSPGVDSTKAGSPDVGGTAKTPSNAPPDEGGASASGSPDVGCPATSASTPGAVVIGDVGDVVGATTSKPAAAAKSAQAAASADEAPKEAMIRREARGELKSKSKRSSRCSCTADH